MLTVVIDTNVLLQCPPLANLDWASIAPEGVCIVIPVAVLMEIDIAKASGSTRRAKKARDISSMFNEALNADKYGLPLKPGSSSRWEFGSGERAVHGELDTGVADHRIVAEALALARDKANLLILTGDTMVQLLARRIGLKVQPLPESWRLSPEADPRDKRIRDLEQRVNALEKDTPTLELSVEEDGAVVEAVTGSFTYLRPPTAEELDDLVDLVRKRHPLSGKVDEDAARLSSLTFGMRYKIPTEGEYAEYRDKHYPGWLARIERYLNTVPAAWSLSQRVMPLQLRLKNTGPVPADGLLFEYEVFGGARLLTADDKERNKLLRVPPLPSPPKAPELELVHPFDGLNTDIPMPRDLDPALFNGTRGIRDAYTFYERDCPDGPTERHSFECEEFRHGAVQLFDVFLLLPATGQSQGKLVFRATASNMRRPFQQAISISHTSTGADPMERLRELVDPPRVTLKLKG